MCVANLLLCLHSSFKNNHTHGTVPNLMYLHQNLKTKVLLSNLPVKIIFRLCTDNDDVINFFSALDAKFDLGCCDVLGELYFFCVEEGA